MKAFDNFEIWWVTGAQLLYGGDAVVAVDGHSKEMVEGLNNSGNIPVKIIYKGTANSSKEVEAVMRLPTTRRNVSVSSPGCTLSLLPRCGSRVCKTCRSLCSISIHSIMQRFPGIQWTWIS